MKKNIGTTDRVIRLSMTLVLIILNLARIITGFWAVIAWIVAAVFLITAWMGSCPLYSILGINSCPLKKNSQ